MSVPSLSFTRNMLYLIGRVHFAARAARSRMRPLLATALSRPEASSVCDGLTDASTAVVRGAAMPAIPNAITSIAGEDFVQECGVRTEPREQQESGANDERTQAERNVRADPA